MDQCSSSWFWVWNHGWSYKRDGKVLIEEKKRECKRSQGSGDTSSSKRSTEWEKWPGWREKILLTQSKVVDGRRWLTRRVQLLIQDRLAWRKRDSSKNVRFLNATGELEGSQRRTTDPVSSLKVYGIERKIVNKNETVLYYLKDGPKRGFVREELLIVTAGTELPPEGIRWSWWLTEYELKWVFQLTWSILVNRVSCHWNGQSRNDVSYAPSFQCNGKSLPTWMQK